MNDIIERLRGSTVYGWDNEESDVGLQAADLIEKLRAEVEALRAGMREILCDLIVNRHIIEVLQWDANHDLKAKIDAALKEKKE